MQALESLGYVVFMNVGESGLGAGDFQAQLEQVLKDTPVVVCLFTDTLSDSGQKEFLRIRNPGDTTRLEIRAALDMRKLIIPLVTAQFDINAMVHTASLPPDVADIGKVNFVPHSDDYFEASISKIHRFIDDEATKGNLDAATTYDGEIATEPEDWTDPLLMSEPEPEPDGPLDLTAPMTKLLRGPGTDCYTHANSLLQSSWSKTEDYKLIRLVEVLEISTPKLQARYADYKKSMPPDVVNGNEQLVFHGCANAAIDSIASKGFLASYQTSAAGSWQRFGPGLCVRLLCHNNVHLPASFAACIC